MLSRRNHSHVPVGLPNTRPCRTTRCPSKITSISTRAELSATHLSRNPRCRSNARHPEATHEQELQPPLTCGPPSTNMGFPGLPPSWDSAAAETVPYAQKLPAPGNIAQALKIADSHMLYPQSSTLHTSSNAIAWLPPSRPHTPSLKVAASFLGHLHHHL
ncbi:hypothetical protein GHT09_007460 [Marmota monax]|uniref:Uncharacterized protein n=1 Tax=Marmota monax TaxID=9995 RepID=A0A834V4B1_MARMO|nr:hypothetical protein GHT09_007460 [Marmota monax]